MVENSSCLIAIPYFEYGILDIFGYRQPRSGNQRHLCAMWRKNDGNVGRRNKSISQCRYETDLPGTVRRKERKVSVEGEAYFEVKKDAKKPFIVDVASMQIKVLGTSFNVNAYPTESKVLTTLDEGSVKIRNAQSNSFDYIMKPGETAIYEKKPVRVSYRKIKITKMNPYG